MEKALEQALVGIITKATTGIDKATDFIVAETPDVVQQLLIWEGVFHGIWFCVGLLLLLIALIGVTRFLIRFRDCVDEYDDLTAEGAVYVLFIIFGGLPGVVFTAKHIDCLKVWFAPKLFLIEYAADLMK